jgi:2-polyprenyl-3-methyl-5-hydroxy-6-metoxy-1,4-benzoquinol methylase
MTVCIICGAKTKFYKKVEKSNLFECVNCKIAYNPALSKIKDYPNNTDYSLKQYIKNENNFKRRFVKLIEHVDIKPLDKHLDIGSGHGLFSLLTLKKLKVRIYTLDSNVTPFFLNGTAHKHYSCRFENFQTSIKFNLISLIDVIEHFEKPIEMLIKVRKLLDETGILVIQTPNYKSLMAKICFKWAWWSVHEHRYFFSPHSMKNILNNNGFMILHQHTYEDIYDFKKNLDGNFLFINNALLRKVTKFIFYSLFFPTYYLFRWPIWLANRGGLIYTVAKKKDI